ncbi:hypothetical protein LguiA_036064 [Lonicera macranthoides]
MPLALLKIFPIASSVLQHCCFRKFAVRFSAPKSSEILGILKRRRLAAIREVLPDQGRKQALLQSLVFPGQLPLPGQLRGQLSYYSLPRSQS